MNDRSTQMSDIRTMLVDSATRLFADHVNAKMLAL